MMFLAKLLGIVLGLYVLLGLYIYVFQYRLLYLPRTYTLELAQSTALENGLILWPTQDSSYLGLLSDPPTRPLLGTVLFFHGNAGSAMDRTYFSDTLNRLGFRVILVEYPAYGAKSGALGEASLAASGIQAVTQAHAEFGDPLYLVAESLGCGVACAVARDTRDVLQGMLLITPWDTLPDMAQQKYPLFPTRWLTKDQYHSIDNLKDFERPLGIVMAAQDTIIRNERTTHLIGHLTQDPHVWTLPDVGHNDWFSAVDGQWWQEVMAYVTNVETLEPRT
ncbi:MAG: alpha/beta hydrolase [Phycisphaerae bacterium]|nr:alpha/beta hydrolase [Phycisphaerae bacterium]